MRTLISSLFLMIGSLSVAQPGSNQDPIATDLDPKEFSLAIQNDDAQLIDVRTPQEFAAGHIPGSRNIDWTGPDYEAAFAELEPERPVLLYCAMGGRSDQARNYLLEKGFKAQHLEGGIIAWKETGSPIEK